MVGAAKINVAGVKILTGDVQTAESLVKEGLQIIEHSIGKQNTSYIEGMTVLGAIYEHCGKPKEAEETYEQGLHLALQTFGSTFTSAGLMTSLANLYVNNNKLFNAKLYYQNAIQIFVRCAKIFDISNK